MKDFEFDLQLFGGGGGKSGGKILGSIALGFLSAGFSFFGAGLSAMTRFVLGASLFSGIWTATHRESYSLGDTSSPDVQRFDRSQETMSSSGQVPVVYGCRKIVGNQTYHKTNSEANALHKHVVLCEGCIEGVQSVCANDLLIPTNGQTKNTVFTIRNHKYLDAEVRLANKHLILKANGIEHDIYLCNRDDASGAGSFYEWQMNISSLIAYINRMGEGWECFPTATTSKYPGDLRPVFGFAYDNFVNVEADTVTGGTEYTFHDCECPDTYEETGAYPNMAWLDMHFNVSSEFNGNPNVEVIVKGKKVYDSRTDTTAYSTNPAMCLRDFLLSKRYGLGRWITPDRIDEDSFAEAANYCDEYITFDNGDGTTTRAKRYELNMVIDQKQSALSWVQEILANFSGYLTYSNGKYKLNVEQPTPVSYRFNDDNLSELSVSPLSLDDTPNRYDVKIIDPKNNWKSISCLCEDYADQKERGKIVSKEIQLNGTTSQHQALRLARFYRDYNLVCPLQFKFSTGLQAMHLEAGDVVTISYRDIWSDLPIRIAEIKESEDGKYEISGRQYNETLYSDDLGGGVHWHSYTNGASTSEDSGAVTPPASPKNLVATVEYKRNPDGKLVYNINISFDLPSRYDTESGLVYYKVGAESTDNLTVFGEGVPADELGFGREWKLAGESNHNLVISNVKLGETYKIRAITKATTGLTSDTNTAPEVTVVVTPRQTVPAKPYNLRYDFSKTFHLDWEDVADSDVVFYEIRTDTSVGMPNGLLGRVNTPHADVQLSKRTGTIYVYAVNAQKKYSYPVSVDYEYPKPEAPSSIDYAEIPLGVNLIIPAFPSTCHKAIFYITSSTVSERIESENCVYSYQGEPDIYSVRASYVDLIGEGEATREYLIPINPTFKPEWIKDGSVSMAKVDDVVKKALNDAGTAITRLDGHDQDILDMNGNIKALQDSDTEFSRTIANVQQGLSADISRVSQKADTISSTVQSQKKELDGTISGLSSKITQNSNQITSVITSLNNKADNSAITQLQDAINLRVQKGDVINQINLTASGTTIKGKYLNIDAETKIGNNVISGNMIKSGAISADKLASGSITADKIATGAITADKISGNSVLQFVKNGYGESVQLSMTISGGLPILNVGSNATTIAAYNSQGRLVFPNGDMLWVETA